MNIDKTPYEEKRPWGSFTTFIKNSQEAPLTVKILRVNPKEAFSLQKHQKREEEWYILSGNGTITIGENSSPIEIGATYKIPQNTLHRLESYTETIVALEIARGHFDEDDITRISDLYGRE